jgi:hypothetical protein
MVIFHSYVSLPEGSAPITQIGEIKSWFWYFTYFTTVSSDVESAQPKLWPLGALIWTFKGEPQNMDLGAGPWIAQMGRAPKRKLEKTSATQKRNVTWRSWKINPSNFPQHTKWSPVHPHLPTLPPSISLKRRTAQLPRAPVETPRDHQRDAFRKCQEGWQQKTHHVDQGFIGVRSIGPRFHENLAGKLGLSLVTMGWGEVCVANQSSSICGSYKLFWPKASRPQNLLQPQSQIIPNHLTGQHWWGWGRAACLDLIIQVPFYMVMIIGLESLGMWLLSSFSVGDRL